MTKTPTIGFIGAGRMAAALAKGFVNAGLVSPDSLIGSDPVPAGREAFGQAVGCETTDSNADVLAKAKVVFLAFKPHQLDEVTEAVRDQFDESHLVISILAGVRLAKLDTACGGRARLVRVMPNTPALVGEGACGYALGQAATTEDGELVKRLLSAVGVAYEVNESLIDAVTGLSGSGPAYGYMIIEALSDGGVAAGLPRDISTRLAAQTMLGAAKMVLETGKHPGELKDMVCSPGGTTIEGVHELEEGGVRSALINAVRAATERAVELGLE
ncbi:MAG: pyrroline-5-carboxylate reductase [Verrucomicrobiales bacterium]|nr:pyrroline-5-carboxylate reductase [Verrucomicrobiales bacterium]